MYITQLNNGLFGRLLGHLSALLIVLGIGFNPSLSLANSQASTEQSKPVILVLGDSLSAAYGMKLEQGWVSLMQDKTSSYQVVNASISGETTSGGKQRLPALMQQHKPAILIIELGANDALRGQNLASTKQNLQTMINACQQAKSSCQPVLLGIRLPTNYGPAYDRLLQKSYETLASQNKLAFHPFFLEDVALDPDLMQWDGLHPNQQAQPVILKTVWQTLKSVDGFIP